MNTNVYAPPQAPLEGNTKPCGECGETIRKKAEICPHCGVRQRSGVNKTALLLLTFFLGGFGAHKFYLRKPVWGVFYLLFFWTWIPGLIAFIEFIIYACTSEESLNEKYEAGGGGVAVVIAVVGAFVMIVIIGILAAIAIPQYAEYTWRAKVQQAMQGTEVMRGQVQDFIVRSGRLPHEPAEVRLDTVEYIGKVATVTLEAEGLMVVRFQDGNGALSGQTIEIAPRIEGGNLRWDCSGGTVSQRSRPQQCRSAQ